VVFPSNLVSTVSDFQGFGGVAGLVAATASAVTKRGTVAVAVNVTDGQPSMFPIGRS
jgi:hypothetical protein